MDPTPTDVRRCVLKQLPFLHRGRDVLRIVHVAVPEPDAVLFAELVVDLGDLSVGIADLGPVIDYVETGTGGVRPVQVVLQEVDRKAIDPRLWDLIIRERLPDESLRILRIWLSGGRVVDQVRQKRVGEVTGEFCIGRGEIRVLLRFVVSPTFVAEKEERLFLALVELRNPYRPTDRRSKLVLVEGSRSRGSCVREWIPRVKGIVTQEPPSP